MNSAQELWWRQAESDFDVYGRMRRGGFSACHILHYLQMTTEKLSKAYLWRAGHSPPKVHTGFVRFLRAIATRTDAELERIAPLLRFGRAHDFELWIKSVLPLAYRIQNLAPAEAGDGPNPEYPWPHEVPLHTPVRYEFSLWTELAETGRGRHLLKFVGNAVKNFPAYC